MNKADNETIGSVLFLVNFSTGYNNRCIPVQSYITVLIIKTDASLHRPQTPCLNMSAVHSGRYCQGLVRPLEFTLVAALVPHKR